MSEAIKNYQTVTLDVIPCGVTGYAILKLNRPERLNSFTQQMHEEVREALGVVELGRQTGKIRALVLTGAGRGFCAGQDLNDRTVSVSANGDQVPADLGGSIEKNYKPLVMTLRNLKMPVIAAVNGVAAGAGANLALACDLVIAAKSAVFIQSFAKLGLVPDTGGSWILPRLIGPARAMGLAMLGDKLSAEKAAEWGMIWQCVEDDLHMATVYATAEKLAQGPTHGLASTKHAIWESSTQTFSAQLDLECDLMRSCGYSADYKEGVSAFLEKRAPVFIGK